MNDQQQHRAITNAAVVATFAFCAWQLTKGNGAPLARLSAPTTQLALRMVAVCIASSIAVAVGVSRAEFPAPPCSYEPSGPHHPPSDELESALVHTGAFDRRTWQVLPEDPLRRYQYLKSVYHDAAPAVNVLVLLTAKYTQEALAAHVRSAVLYHAVAFVFAALEHTQGELPVAPADVSGEAVEALLDATLEEFEARGEATSATPDSVLDGASLPVTPDVQHGRVSLPARSESFNRARSPTWVANHSFDSPPPPLRGDIRKASLSISTRSSIVLAAEASDVLMLPTLRHEPYSAVPKPPLTAIEAEIKAQSTAAVITPTTPTKPTTRARRPDACRTRAEYAADPTVKAAYRHDPYSHRAFVRLDVGTARRDTVTLPFVQHGANGEAPTGVTKMDVPMALLFKPNTAALSIRPRLSGGFAGSVKSVKTPNTGSGSDRGDTSSRCSTVPSMLSPKATIGTPKTPMGAGIKSRSPSVVLPAALAAPPPASLPPAEVTDAAHDEAKEKQAKISAARKAMKKTYDASGMTLSEPFFGLTIDVDESDVPTADVDAESPGTPVRLSAPMLFEHGQVTMTGLPNIDGHRVAVALLTRLASFGVIEGGFALATPERRTDRFNTGACHITLDRVDDARRLYDVLNRMSLFADHRGGDIVVTRARS